MSAEQAYRAALRWYPAGWRRANAEVLVGTLLDVADAEGRSEATRDELRDLRRSGLATRADAIMPGAVRDRVAAISLGAGTALALALLTGQLWSAWWTQASPLEPLPDGVVWQVLVHPAIWVLAALATFAGAIAAARILLIATLPASLISMNPDAFFLLRPSLFTLVMMGVLALLACVGRPPRRWLVVSTGTGVVLIAAWLLVLGPFAGTYFPRGGLVDLIGSPWPVVVLLGAMVVLLARRRRVDAVALMLASAPWIVNLAGALYWYHSGHAWVPKLIVSGAIVVLVPLVILLVVRRYARAPWHSPSESSDSRTSASRPSSTR